MHKIQKDIRNLTVKISTPADKVDVGCLLWQLQAQVKSSLQAIKQDLEREPPGFLTGSQGSASIQCHTPKLVMRHVPYREMLHLQNLVGEAFEEMFDVDVNVRIRDEGAVMIHPQCATLLSDWLETVEDPPTVHFHPANHEPS